MTLCTRVITYDYLLGVTWCVDSSVASDNFVDFRLSGPNFSKKGFKLEEAGL